MTDIKGIHVNNYKTFNELEIQNMNGSTKIKKKRLSKTEK